MAKVGTLQSIFNFNEDDLTVNRTGALSSAQIHTMKNAARIGAIAVMVVCGIFFVPILLATIGFYGAYISISDSFSGPEYTLLIPVFVFGTIGLIFAYFMLRSLWTIMSPKVPPLQRVSGALAFGNKTKGDIESEIEVGGKQFTIDNAALKLLDTEKRYTVYYTKNDFILAIEEGVTGWNVVPGEGTKSALEYEGDVLKNLYHFTDADLMDNKRGTLSDAQKARMQVDASNNLGCYLLLIPVAAFPLIMIGGFTNNWILAIGVSALVFVVLAIAIRNGARDRQKEITIGAVKETSGVATVAIRKHRTTGKNAHTVTNYFVSVGELEFQVSEEAYSAFKEGKTYRIYYMGSDEDSNEIISAEQVV